MLRMCHKFSDLNDGSITGKLAVNLNKLNSFCLFTFQETCALPRSITRVRPRYEFSPGMTPQLNAANMQLQYPKSTVVHCSVSMTQIPQLNAANMQLQYRKSTVVHCSVQIPQIPQLNAAKTAFYSFTNAISFYV